MKLKDFEFQKRNQQNRYTEELSPKELETNYL